MKTSNVRYAGSVNPFKGKLCGTNYKCCTFQIPANSLKKNGILVLTSNKLGNCKDFPIGANIKFVHLEKIGDDTWFGKGVEIVTKRASTKGLEINSKQNV